MTDYEKNFTGKESRSVSYHKKRRLAVGNIKY
jgi:hypothetical protein